MKTKRFLLAAAIATATAACSGDLTAPDPDARAPGAVPAASTSESPEPVVVSPEEPVNDGSGQVGSGCCVNR